MSQRGFDLVAVFDTDPRKVGMKVGKAREAHRGRQGPMMAITLTDLPLGEVPRWKTHG